MFAHPSPQISLKGKDRYIFETLLYFNMLDLAEEWQKVVSNLITEENRNQLTVPDEKAKENLIDFLKDAFIEILRVPVLKMEKDERNQSRASCWSSKANYEKDINFSRCSADMHCYSEKYKEPLLDFNKTNPPSHILARVFCRELRDQITIKKNDNVLINRTAKLLQAQEEKLDVQEVIFHFETEECHLYNISFKL